MLAVGSLLRYGSIVVLIAHIIACMGGCLGSHSKPKPVTSIDEPLKGPKLQGQKVSKPSISEDFWTTSACDMDNSAVQSRGSISSISTSNLIMDTHGSSSGNTSSEFVNHGLLLWNQNRQQWIGNKKPENRAQQLHEPKLSWNSTYDSLLGSSKPFSQPVPLAFLEPAMALARLAFKNMGQRVASPSCYSLASQSLVNRSLDTAQKQRWGSDPPRGFSASSGDHHEKSDGREVAVSDKGDKKFKLFPRKQRKRGLWRTNDDRNFDVLPSGLGNALVQATENINKLLENFSPSRLIGRFKEHDECYKLRYLMPGLGKEDVKIAVEDGVLRIRGEHKEVDEEESDDELFSAVRYGYYDFTVVLPEDAKPDEIKAEMKDGVLTIIIPRTETPKKDVKEVQID